MTAGATTQTETEWAACASCGAPLTGPFCAACGERALRPGDTSIPRFVAGAVSDAFSLDGRLLRSLRALLVAPGRLTREFMAGRRVPYLGPLQLFLIANLVYFGCSR